jgi:ubiquinone/menaquinone biosynthesis C-methylase UbiE
MDAGIRSSRQKQEENEMSRDWRNRLKEKIDEIRLIKFFQKHTVNYQIDPDDLAVNGYKIFGGDSDMFDLKDFQAMVGNLRSQLRLEGSERLLEVGCGSGLLAQALAGSCAQYVGIDISANMVALAQRKDIPQAQFYCMNGKKLKFSDNSFHRVFAYFVFMNFPHWHYCEQILAEMLRVVSKDQGLILIGSLPDKDKQPQVSKVPQENQDQTSINLVRRFSQMLSPDITIQYFDKSLFLEWGARHGLKTEIVQSVIGKYSPYRFDVIYSIQ